MGDSRTLEDIRQKEESTAGCGVGTHSEPSSLNKINTMESRKFMGWVAVQSLHKVVHELSPIVTTGHKPHPDSPQRPFSE